MFLRVWHRFVAKFNRNFVFRLCPSFVFVDLNQILDNDRSQWLHKEVWLSVILIKGFS